MRLQILLAGVLLLVLSFSGVAQETPENAEPEKAPETTLLDEFGLVGDCEFSARVDALFIKLGNEPKSKAYIIIYRGSEDLPSRQTEGFFRRRINAFRNYMGYKKYDESRVVLIDGGFRQRDTSLNELWVVPEGGTIPKPTETVEKPETPTGKAYLVDELFLAVEDAAIQKESEIYEEPETPDADVPETTDLAPEAEAVEPESAETVQPADEIFYEPEEEYNSMSDYFAAVLKGNRAARGVVIFYIDEEEYDISKSQQIIADGLQKLAAKSEVDLSGVKIVFGGYRSENKIQFWIVPKDAKEPLPTPEQKPQPKERES